MNTTASKYNHAPRLANHNRRAWHSSHDTPAASAPSGWGSNQFRKNRLCMRTIIITGFGVPFRFTYARYLKATETCLVMTYKYANTSFRNWTSPQRVIRFRRFETNGLETSGTNYPARWCHIPKQRIPPPPRCKHLKTRTINLKSCFTLDCLVRGFNGLTTARNEVRGLQLSLRLHCRVMRYGLWRWKRFINGVKKQNCHGHIDVSKTPAAFHIQDRHPLPSRWGYEVPLKHVWITTKPNGVTT
jgi:hypothetical protein